MPIPADRCVDDTHMVTEREWQEIQADMQKLEGQMQELTRAKRKTVAH